jgi:hypothetical protein
LVSRPVEIALGDCGAIDTCAEDAEFKTFGTGKADSGCWVTVVAIIWACQDDREEKYEGD